MSQLAITYGYTIFTYVIFFIQSNHGKQTSIFSFYVNGFGYPLCPIKYINISFAEKKYNLIIQYVMFLYIYVRILMFDLNFN